MALRYACFISYQRGNELVDRFARELFHRLSNELTRHTGLGAWFDTARLDVGDKWEDRMLDALASSVCLVPILTPTYFSVERPYCTREFLGMQKIGAFRIEQTHRKDSFIIPVVLRQSPRFARAIGSAQFFDFSDYFASGSQQFHSKDFDKSVVTLGQRIGKLCQTYGDLDLSNAPPAALPSKNETLTWLTNFEQTIRLPNL